MTAPGYPIRSVPPEARFASFYALLRIQRPRGPRQQRPADRRAHLTRLRPLRQDRYSLDLQIFSSAVH